MKIISYYTDTYSKIGELNKKRWQQYCDIHGYEFSCPKLPEQSTPYWKKMELWLNELETSTHDYIVWTDIDVLVLNMEKKISDFIIDCPISISSDDCGLCCGFIIIKRCDWSINFFKSAYFFKDVIEEKERLHSTRKLEDQSCIRYLWDGFYSVKNNIQLLDQTIISHPRIGIQENSFAHHFWGNPIENRDLIYQEMKSIINK